MSKLQPVRTTIKNDPFSAVIPAPADDPPPVARRAGKAKLTVHLDADLVNRVKNAAYWNPRLTIARIAEEGVRTGLEAVERDNGGPYPQRESELAGGRPLK
jgi:hypothetical protein